MCNLHTGDRGDTEHKREWLVEDAASSQAAQTNKWECFLSHKLWVNQRMLRGSQPQWISVTADVICSCSLWWSGRCASAVLFIRACSQRVLTWLNALVNKRLDSWTIRQGRWDCVLFFFFYNQPICVTSSPCFIPVSITDAGLEIDQGVCSVQGSTENTASM